MLLKAERERYNRMPIVAWNFTFGDPDVEMPWPPLAIGQSLLRVYQPHIHDEIEVHQIRRGRVFAEICGQPLTLEPGDILIVNPWELHQGSIPDDIVTEYIHTTFLPAYFAGSCGAAGDVFRRLQAGELGFSNHLAADHPAAAEIGRTLDIIYAAYCAAASGEVAETAADCRLASAASAMMAALLASVPLTEPGESRVRSARFIHEAQKYVEQRFMLRLTTEQVASEMGYNVSYFCTMFKENFGMPFKQYLNAHRIEYAKTWYRGLPLTEMAEKLGFSDYNYFARVFRQQTGMTPSEYFGRK